MEIRALSGPEIGDAVDLIWTTFLQFEAPEYSPEGVRAFQDFIENREILQTLHMKVEHISAAFL